MKKIILIAALAIMAGAVANTADAAKRKKKKTETVLPAPVVLATSSDSLSYAAGAMLTNGLMDYLRQQLHVDTAYMADFVRGFQEGVAENNDPREVAVRAGRKIAEQVKDGMLPRMKAEFTDTPDSIITTLLFRGFTDAVMNDTTVMKVAAAQTLFVAKEEQNARVKTERKKQEGRDYLAANAQRDGVITTPSGLQYKILVQGDGEVPQATDRVKVNYEGRLIDGTIFDASSSHGNTPAEFAANQVISGWTEALTMMPVGSKWELYIPYNLAYGERQMGQIPAYSTLIFTVELVGIVR